MSASIGAAYERCEAITHTRAANFYYGIRLLPRERRRAMCAVYAFARRVDDIGDGPLAAAEKLRLLEVEGQALAGLAQARPGAGGTRDEVMLALCDVNRRFELPLDALEDLLRGVRMDVEGVSYERFDELVVYCRRVAGAVGRVCLAIFGERSAGAQASAGGAGGASAASLADDLGVALQLTNILRDLREDAGNGRVYIPAEDLVRFGLIENGERAGAAAHLAQLMRQRAADRARNGALDALVRFEAQRAQGWFDRGLRLTPLLDRRSAACVLAMAGIYHRLLERIEQHPERALERRISLPLHEKLWVAASSTVGRRG